MRIAGHASLFGVADLSRDVVEAGAFAAALARRGGGIRMLFQHDPARPVGVWTSLREDAQGLAVQGRLTAGASAELAALIADGAIDGLSIGFRTVKARTDPRTRLRHIVEADLWEISIVTFPMLPGARLAVLPPDRPLAPATGDLARAARQMAALISVETSIINEKDFA
ncbi:HK97 family phage prohead protease [Aquibium carbonis]|uniref:HK97 family phage prohead protease n=1 Tax=Aquibium carbonis TaxID=2495581 RepID=A0A3R9YGR8_9HYPH|nr:HK97 family phage prohead protease [Aquibium carbonis]RST78919.1 HK97 family phage prohead protease [Aquibium carbonis]